jgi:hypothetical protein
MKPLAFVVALLGAGIVAGCGAPTEAPVETRDVAAAPQVPEEWTTYRDRARGFSVTYPPGWFRAGTRLTPHLADPRELLSLATYPLRPGSDRCAQHIPVNALDDLGPTDAFLTIQERRDPSTEHSPPRPDRFELPADTRSDANICEAGRALTEWIAFRDEGRAFYALYAVGPRADDDTRSDLLRILDRLEFEPRR